MDASTKILVHERTGYIAILVNDQVIEIFNDRIPFIAYITTGFEKEPESDSDSDEEEETKVTKVGEEDEEDIEYLLTVGFSSGDYIQFDCANKVDMHRIAQQLREIRIDFCRRNGVA
jgi:hypothetical protein